MNFDEQIMSFDKNPNLISMGLKNVFPLYLSFQLTTVTFYFFHFFFFFFLFHNVYNILIWAHAVPVLQLISVRPMSIKLSLRL